MRELSLSVPQGQMTALLGANGAGKTTLLRILASTITPDAGSVRILGEDALAHPGRVRHRVGVVLGDERSFFWRLTAAQNLRFFAALHGLHGRTAQDRIDTLAAQFRFGDEMNQAFRNLSTGWRHKLALVRALLGDPAVLLMDEPTRGLDPGAAERAHRYLAEDLVGKQGKTVLIATHRLAEARQHCQGLALLSDGHIVAEGPVEKVAEQVAAEFELSESEMK
ncbi:MAG: ABC transporter ATP-binding protein [Deltaproteobacteria bacterium]|nr:ABC transporter ATP-binding protein [Deltaproteobacteria bacterium]